MICVPTTPFACPTVPTHVGTQKTEQFRAVDPLVPTVPTYVVYITRDSSRATAPHLPAEKFGAPVGTKERSCKPAEICRFCVPSTVFAFPPLLGEAA